MDRKFVSLFLVAVGLPVALAAGSANACDAPGTPTNATADVIWNFPPTIGVSWKNTANDDETVFWDVEITDGRTPPTFFPQQPGFGRGDTGRGLIIFNSWPANPPIQPDGSFPSVKRCFRLKARLGPDSQGCLSEIWGNQTCATTTASPTISFPRALYAKNIDAPLLAPDAAAINVQLTLGDCLFSVHGCPVTPEFEIWDYDAETGHLLLHASNECVSIGDGRDPGSPIILSPCAGFNDLTDKWRITEIGGSSVWFIQNSLTEMCLNAVPGTIKNTGTFIEMTPATLVQQPCNGTLAQQFSVANAEWVRQPPTEFVTSRILKLPGGLRKRRARASPLPRRPISRPARQS
jgi:hypothetical protein